MTVETTNYKVYQHPLVDPIIFRIHRCQLEITSIQKALEEFNRDNLIDIQRRIRPDRRVVEFLVGDFDPTYFFLAISEELSDVFHRLRSVLDHMAVALALIENPTLKNDVRIYFPIYEDSSGFEKAKSKLRKLYSPSIIAAFESLQPYNNPPIKRGYVDPFSEPKKNFLALLHGIINKDKHWCCLIGMHGYLSSKIDMEFVTPLPPGAELFTEECAMPSVVSKALIARVTCSHPFPMDFSIGVDLQTASFIRHGEDKYAVIPTMFGIFHEVLRSISVLSQLFPPQATPNSPVQALIKTLGMPSTESKTDSAQENPKSADTEPSHNSP